MTTQAPIDFTLLSARNDGIPRQKVVVANGATFVALALESKQLNHVYGTLYMHVHSSTRRCYVGITDQVVGKRWHSGIAYKNNRRFGHALAKYGWSEFESYVLALFDSRDGLNAAEVQAIAAAGGHKSSYTFNLSPGGDMVAENDKPLVGIHLPTGKQQTFKSGADAARMLRMNVDMPMAVARGERTSVADWWFRFADKTEALPPEIWGEDLRVKGIRRRFGKAVVAIHYETGETREFPTTTSAALALGVEQTAISQVSNGISVSAKGWWVRFADDVDRKMPTMHGLAVTRAKRDRKIYATNLKTGKKREFRNCTVADTELGIYKGASSMVASGGRTSAAGWWFSYKKDAMPPTEYKGVLVAKARSKAVIATHVATSTVKHYGSAKAAASDLGMSRAAISKSIKNGGKPTMGYSFNFADTTE